MPPTIELEHATDYFFPKWGFARNLDELGGVTSHFGLRSSPVIVAPTLAAEAHDTTHTTRETTRPETLDAAREIRQRYSSAVKDKRLDDPGASATTEGGVTAEHRSPSPFQTKFKPPGADTV